MLAVDGGVTFDYTPEDDAPCQLSLYCLDFDRRGWPLQMTVIDDFGNVLDTRKLSADEVKQGVYCIWKERGSIRVLAESDRQVRADLDEGVVRGTQITISGVFVDPIEP